MAYNAAFIVVQSANPSLVVLQDTSTGSDPDITSKTITLYNVDGTVYASSNWPVGDSTLSLSILSKDVALNIVMTVNSSNPEPDPSTYEYSLIYAFTRYEKNFVYSLTQKQTANPSIAQDQNFYFNKLRLLCDILSAENAIDIGEDVFAAEQRISAGNYLVTNAFDYF